MNTQTEAKQKIFWSGWITGLAKDFPAVQSIPGIELTNRQYESGDVNAWTFDCRIPDESMDKLDPFWGEFVWGLERDDHDAE